MSELLVLREIFDMLGEKKSIDLKDLHKMLESPILSPYLGDFESFKATITRLELDGTLELEKSGSEIEITGYDKGSKFHDKIAKLEALFSQSKDDDDFKEKIYTCELNQHFLDTEEVKIVYFYLNEKPPVVPVEKAPVEKVTVASEEKKETMGTDDKMTNEKEITELRNIQEMKIKKLEQITRDYVEELLKDENEIDRTTLAYLLDELLPLKEMREDEVTLIMSAIKERNLPWILDGDVFKRTGELVKKTLGKDQHEENKILKEFTNFLMSSLGNERSIGIDDFKAKLEETDFFKETSKEEKDVSMESLLEESIEHGMFTGYVDAEERTIVRPKSAEEKYQETFKRELDRLSEEIMSDEKKIESLKRTEEKIPQDLESLLKFPEKPRDVMHALDKVSSGDVMIQDFILKNTPVGKKVSIIELNDKLQDYLEEKKMDLPFSITSESIEKILEGMVKNRMLVGYFEDDEHFKREAS
ncbi:MAG: hypothetical protein ACFFCS_25300 [Candidatus Hodarchaeota archaeon]